MILAVQAMYVCVVESATTVAQGYGRGGYHHAHKQPGFSNSDKGLFTSLTKILLSSFFFLRSVAKNPWGEKKTSRFLAQRS